MNLKAWWKLFRAEHAVMVFVAVILTEALVAGYLTLSHILAAFGPTFITLGAFAFNDYAGFVSDKALNRKDRPIVAGLINRSHALYASLILFLAGAALSFAYAPRIGFAIAIAYGLLSIAYDLWLKKLPLVGNVFVASTYAASYYYGNIVVTSELNFFVLAFIGMSFLSGLGREFIITLRDVAGDKKTGAKTLPMILGTKKTLILAAALIYVSVVLSVAPLTKTFSWPYLILIVIADAIWLGITALLFLKQDASAFKNARNYSLCALLIGLIAFASLVFA